MNISILLQAAFYLFAGVSHFRNPRFFLKIMPPWLPQHELMNYISGAAEIVLALLFLIPYTRPFAAWGIILLLIAVFPANVYHLMQKGAGMNVPLWVLWLRLPLQAVLIWWAWIYTR